jgi:hypothetical protein
LQDIRALSASNQTDAARRQLQCWQRANPQTTVPDDLKSLLN